MKMTASKVLLSMTALLAVFSIGVVVAHADPVVSPSYNISVTGLVTTQVGVCSNIKGSPTPQELGFAPSSSNLIYFFSGAYPATTTASGISGGPDSNTLSQFFAVLGSGSSTCPVIDLPDAAGPQGPGDYWLWFKTHDYDFYVPYTVTATGTYAYVAPVDWTGLNATNTPLTALYGNSASDTLSIIQSRCSGAGNVFSEGICAGFSFLFIPDPSITNGYVQLAAVSMPAKFPFSWVAEGKAIFDSLSAPTSSDNFTATVLDMHSLGIGSTTAIGNILPTVTAISSSTITQFLPAGMWATIQSLLAAFAWIALFWYIWHRVNRRFNHV